VFVSNLGLVPVSDDIYEAKELRVPLEPEATYLSTLFIISPQLLYNSVVS
jgi:hypothetical protein